jgi:hypothetical protein
LSVLSVNARAALASSSFLNAHSSPILLLLTRIGVQWFAPITTSPDSNSWRAVAHALVMMYQLIALNVAINSYDHALLTLLVSNQFVEIKGSVFKKFEKDNLFQITCAGS